MADRPATVDDYIGSFPEDIRTILAEIRRTILTVVPTAGSTISYGMPTMTLEGKYLIYFAAWKHHISVYPVPRAVGYPEDPALERDIAPYRAARDTVQFPLGKPVPYELLGRITAFLVHRRRGPDAPADMTDD